MPTIALSIQLESNLKNNRFSILELLTVIIVILLLLSLLLPTISLAKRKALNVMCYKNLKDIHSLMMNYAVDHGNVLPGREWSDFEGTVSSYGKLQNSMYAHWNGHLIPYIDTTSTLRDWKRIFHVRFNNKWYNDDTGAKAKESDENYNLIKDTSEGVGLFRMFCCPDVIENIRDPGLYYEANKQGKDFDFPKVYNSTIYEKYFKKPVGLPTTYAANDEIISGTNGDTSPKTISAFKNFGTKALLVEGGISTDELYAAPYITVAQRLKEAGDLDMSQVGLAMWDTNQFSFTRQTLTFPHDDEGEVWHSTVKFSKQYQKEKCELYNAAYTSKAYLALGVKYHAKSHDLTMVTQINPYNSNLAVAGFKDVFGFDWSGKNFNYVGNEIIYKGATGKSNLLFGDGRVSTEHASWIINNRQSLFKGLD